MASDVPSQEVVAPYAVWGIPSAVVRMRMKKLNEALRCEFGGPELDPHLTVVGMTNLTREDALKKFKAACHGLKAYPTNAKSVSAGNSYWQCVYVELDPTAEVVETSAHCNRHFGNVSTGPYMPHMSLMYGDLTEEEKKKAIETAKSVDESLGTASFNIDRLELWITDGDKTLKSWVRVAHHQLEPLL